MPLSPHSHLCDGRKLAELLESTYLPLLGEQVCQLQTLSTALFLAGSHTLGSLGLVLSVHMMMSSVQTQPLCHLSVVSGLSAYYGL